MTIWLDAQFSPAIAKWMSEHFGIQVVPLRDLGLRDAKDIAIHAAAKSAGALVMTKDRDFVDLQQRLGTPPQILHVTCGNTSNAALREVLTEKLPVILEDLRGGESLVTLDDG